MSKKCKFKFYSQSGKECVYPPSIGSEFCIWHDPEVKKDEEFVRIRLKSAIKETGGDLEGFLLRKADLSSMDLREVDLRDADLREADMEDADCSRADFRGAKLNRVYAAGTNFEGANFMAANLSDGNFVNANFQNCNLRIVNLGHADVRGGDFTGSDVRNTDFSQTEQNDATNFTGVTGITAKIILADPEPAIQQEGPEFVAPQPEVQSPFDAVGEDTFIPSAPAEAPPLFGDDTPQPASGAFAAEDGPESIFGDMSGDNQAVEAFSGFHTADEAMGVPTPPGEVQMPQTAQTSIQEAPMQVPFNEPAQGTGIVQNDALETGSAAFKTDITSAGSKRESEDETDFRLDAVNEDALTSKYKMSKGGALKKIAVIIIVLAILAGGGYVGLQMFSGKNNTNGNGTSNGKGTVKTAELEKLKKEVEKLKTDLAEKEKNLSEVQSGIAEKDKEIASLNDRIVKLAAAASSGNDEKLKVLQDEKAVIEKKLADLEQKYKKVSAENEGKMDKIINMAARTTEMKEKNDELVANNKKLQQQNKDLEDQIKEGQEILKEYKKRLDEAEAAKTTEPVAVAVADDPILKNNPGLKPMVWDEYRIFAPEKTSYLVGLKFVSEMNGGFINMTIMIFGEAPASKPNFRITFRDMDGTELTKKYKINLSKRGLNFQQVLLKTQGWRVQGNPPKYIMVEFF